MRKFLALALAGLMALAGLVPVVADAQVTNAPSAIQGRFIATGLPAPTMGTCGTATVAGTDSAGRITISAGTPSTCALVFGTAYATAPACVVMLGGPTLADAVGMVATTTSGFTATIVTGTWDNASVLDYICIGR